MRPIGIAKRPRKSEMGGVKSAKVIENFEKLVEKVHNLKYIMGLVYKMLNAKELGVGIEKIEIPTRPLEAREKLERNLERILKEC